MLRRLENITYDVVPDDQIRNYVIKTCEAEWDAEDFPKVGEDLYKSEWRLEEVDVDKITVNKEQLESDVFQKDVQPRIAKQKELNKLQTPIPSLILRGSDLLIFDGYARWHVLKELGVKKCLAYVGRR